MKGNHARPLILAAYILAVSQACGAQGEPLAFPGAKGFGVNTPAGRGGKIVRVTNLDATGPGSFRAALETSGPRIVVFEVGGVIDLDRKKLRIAEPYLTVAGQTAPSPGITVIRGSISIASHDLLIQHIRVRPGDAGQPRKSGWSPDGMTTSNGECHDIVIDHCSCEWAVDENLSASGPRYDGPEATTHNVTFSNCIIAEGLNNSSHGKGPHSKGSLIHDNCTRIAIIGNLYAHNVDRNPYFKAFTTGVIVNNVIYNPVSNAIEVNWPANEWKEKSIIPQNARVSVVGNVMIHGEDTPKNRALVQSKGDVYLEDNVALDRAGNPAPMTAGKINILKEKPVWPEGLEALPPKGVIEYVIYHAGARPKDRDEIDKRIIREFRERKGRIIDSQDQVGGYPKCEMTKRPLVIPEKGVEEWLVRLAQEIE